jgi:hypothetical protein
LPHLARDGLYGDVKGVWFFDDLETSKELSIGDEFDRVYAAPMAA